VMFTGFLIGLLLSKLLKTKEVSQLARNYYVVIATLLVFRTAAFASSALMNQPNLWRYFGGSLGDLLGLLFGALFGVAALRSDARAFLTDDSILWALRMVLAFTFSVAALGKAFSLAPMQQFFVQSGYSLTFLKFIIIAEVFGALGLLLPWAVIPALIGLSVDMFGAVLTHIHNGDPLNDSTGAILLLVRLVAVGTLWALLPRRSGHSPRLRHSIMSVAAVALCCLLIAVSGSIAIRSLSGPATTAIHP
jgi:DoxX-like family